MSNTSITKQVQPTQMSPLVDRWQTVVDNVKQATNLANRNTNNVQLLAVSKTKPVEMVEELAAVGQQHFGENYLQEALAKIEALKHLPDIHWHYIGSIQRNKTKDIAQNFDWVHTIERAIIAKRLNDQRPDGLSKLNVLIQVNIDDEASKSGCQPNELESLIEEIMQYEKLQLRGLMIIPAKNGSDAFVKTNQLFQQIKQSYPELTMWDTLSMGMSNDMDIAIANGSTIVRVGTAIFGARN
ncbi:YggS family pyridoxal phosphate-dependent enzyme [Psychrobacter sp. HD31]